MSRGEDPGGKGASVFSPEIRRRLALLTLSGLANRGGRAPEEEARNRLDALVNDDTRTYPANRMIVTKGTDSTNRD